MRHSSFLFLRGKSWFIDILVEKLVENLHTSQGAEATQEHEYEVVGQLLHGIVQRVVVAYDVAVGYIEEIENKVVVHVVAEIAFPYATLYEVHLLCAPLTVLLLKIFEDFGVFLQLAIERWMSLAQEVHLQAVDAKENVHDVVGVLHRLVQFLLAVLERSLHTLEEQVFLVVVYFV